MAITCSINKLKFDEMFLRLQEVVPQDSVDFVRDETARLAEECATQLARRGSAKGGLIKDVRSVFAPLPSNAFTQQSKIDGAGMKWLSACDKCLIGVKSELYRVDSSIDDMKGMYYQNKGTLPTERRIILGSRTGTGRHAKGGTQTIYGLQRYVVKRGTLKKFVQTLKAHYGRLEASFAQTAQILRGKAKVNVRVSRHFPSRTNITEAENLANRTTPGVTFGSFAPGVENFEGIIDQALIIRTEKMFARLGLIFNGYATAMTATRNPEPMSAITTVIE